MTDIVVKVTGLTKLYNGFKAVDNISFEMKRGEILGIIGPNGAGKTTTLQMLLDLTEPTAGTIAVFGLPLKQNREEILGRVNFSSSYISLPYSLTVRENLTVFARLYGVKGHSAKIDALLDTFEIAAIKNTPVRGLSSGQVTRACLCKALLNDPEVLFLDEPTANLDPDIADKTRRLLKKIRDEKGVSILYTSHNMREMEELCDRVIFMENGRILAQGRPDEIKKEFNSLSFDEVFLKVSRRKVAS